MIFVTVGTHEQPFNRLIQKVDELKKDGVITEDVIIQTGFSTYEPKYWSCCGSRSYHICIRKSNCKGKYGREYPLDAAGNSQRERR